MAELNSQPPQRLFKQWREGDAAAGQAMAQRFSDWYYAICASRLGDQVGRGPLQRSCTRFQQGIMAVTRPEEVVEWAHAILVDEVRNAGGRSAGGDFPNQLTGGKSPSEILVKVRKHLSKDDVRILAHAYDGSFPIERVQQETAELGGLPVAVLGARYRLKRALKEHAGIALVETPEVPNLDYAPIPLYEAGRMRNAAEEGGFEKWVLGDLSLCRDIAEFGVFALALRNGAYGEVTSPEPVEPPAPAPLPTAPPPAAAPPPPTVASGAADPFAEPTKKGMSPMLLAGVAVAGLGFLAVAALAAAWALGLLGG